MPSLRLVKCLATKSFALAASSCSSQGVGVGADDKGSGLRWFVNPAFPNPLHQPDHQPQKVAAHVGCAKVKGGGLDAAQPQRVEQRAQFFFRATCRGGGLAATGSGLIETRYLT